MAGFGVYLATLAILPVREIFAKRSRVRSLRSARRCSLDFAVFLAVFSAFLEV
jgi:hypothetical protein